MTRRHPPLLVVPCASSPGDELIVEELGAEDERDEAFLSALELFEDTTRILHPRRIAYERLTEIADEWKAAR